MMDGGASSSSSWWRYAFIGSAAVATGAAGYYTYRYFSTKGDDNQDVRTVHGQDVSDRLQIVRALQMRTIAPTPPGRPHAPSPPKPKAPSGGPAAGGGSGGMAANNKKLCAECRKPLSGLPLRCSSCKVIYYCSKECQKNAWPAHKDQCKASAAGGGTEAAGSNPSASSDDLRNTSTEVESSETAAAAAEVGGGTSSGSMQAALEEVLAESAAGNANRLESLFETSVLSFLRGNYRDAITQLLAVQDLARSKSEAAVEGEVYKWLGHCWSKLSDARKAEAYFLEGAEFAHSKGLVKCEVDCLGGLGVLHRSQNDPARAMMYLGKGLELAEGLGDLDLKATMLCNMGNVLMQVDQEKAQICLQNAVVIREEAIEKMHDSGDRAGLATAVMEHATSMVNLAGSLYVTKKLDEAKACYERALEVFELVEDHDKVVKVLVNLANMCELQMQDKAGHQEAAAGYRDRLLTFLQSTGARVPEDTCAVCLDPMRMASPAEPGKELIMLACLHCLHDVCWNKHIGTAGQEAKDVVCPTCRQPVLLYE